MRVVLLAFPANIFVAFVAPTSSCIEPASVALAELASIVSWTATVPRLRRAAGGERYSSTVRTV